MKISIEKSKKNQLTKKETHCRLGNPNPKAVGRSKNTLLGAEHVNAFFTTLTHGE